MPEPAKFTEDLAEWATTERQKQYLEACIKHGSMRAAARAMGVAENAVRESMGCLRRKAARQGHAPGHWDDGVAPGYVMGKVTVQRAGGAVERTWERQHPELRAILEAIQAAVEAAREELPLAAAAAAPATVREDMCTQYTVTDFHFGALAHAEDGDGLGADWNLEIAEETLVRSITHLVDKAPDSGTAILAFIGDLLHFDGPDPVTPTHRHPLDAAGRQRGMVRVVVRAIRRVVQVILAKHGRLVVVVCEGNHDLAATPWLREILLTHYENEPRVEVLDKDLPYQAVEFGVNFIGFSHGHKRKKESLPALFVAMFREMWGRTKTGIIHTGHYHSADEKDFPGVRLVQHRTMTAPDSHALRGGWFSEREMASFHYHRLFGPQGRDMVTPEMLGARRAA
jgi:hypothetical protein